MIPPPIIAQTSLSVQHAIDPGEARGLPLHLHRSVCWDKQTNKKKKSRQTRHRRHGRITRADWVEGPRRASRRRRLQRDRDAPLQMSGAWTVPDWKGSRAGHQNSDLKKINHLMGRVCGFDAQK